VSTEIYIIVNRWSEFQHYKDRDPKWIKNYQRLLHDQAYLDLTGHQRAVLHGLWLLYASSGCQLTLNSRSLSRQLSLRVTSDILETLNHAGFITFSASSALAQRREEKNREELPTHPPSTTTDLRRAGGESENGLERLNPLLVIEGLQEAAL
jgi:hypothetical protein